MDQPTLQELKTALLQEREKLVAELKAIAKPNPAGVAGDWNAQYPQFEPAEYGSHASLETEADEVEEYEAALEAEHSLESRLLAVNKALARVERGTYGVCLKCGKEISLERLKANPPAEVHTEHAA